MFPKKLMACVVDAGMLEATRVELAWLARHLDCTLVIFHSFSPYVPAAPQSVEEVLRQRRRLEEAARNPAFEGLDVRVVWDDEPRSLEPGILETADHLGVDLVVLPTHPRRGLPRLARRSVAEDLLRDCRIPVLTFDLERLPTDVVEAAFDRVICPTDFSPFAAKAMTIGFGLARRLGCPVTALHVSYEVPFTIDERVTWEDIEQWIARDARERLEDEVSSSRGAEGPPYETVVRAGKVTRVVKDVAGEARNPLVIMATAGRDSLGDHVLGSRTERVVRTAGCSVLTLPPFFLASL